MWPQYQQIRLEPSRNEHDKFPLPSTIWEYRFLYNMMKYKFGFFL